MKKSLLTFWKIGARVSADLPELLKKHDIEMKINPNTRWYTEDELIEELQDIDAVLAGGDPYSSKVIESLDRVKIIARLGVGYDRVDIDAATKKNIYVTITPCPELFAGVADETFTLILSSIRAITQMDRHVREGGWDMEYFCTFIRDTYPLTLGILGLGNIGTEVAKRARGFDMKVIYYDPIRKEDLEKKLGVSYVSFDELLRNSDVLSVHCPLNDSTRGLIGEKEIEKMKEGAFIVNTARGPLIQEDSLYKALEKGKLAGAGLGTLSEEPPTEKSPFYKLGDKLPNVVLLPHTGIGKDSAQAMTHTAAEDVIAVLEGKKPKYALNPEVSP